MVVCYNIHECPVRFRSDAACESRFISDSCPHSQLGDINATMSEQSDGEMSNEESD